MGKKKNKGIKHNIILFFCGFLVFSPLSSTITMQFLGLPIALPELLFIPFYFLIKKRMEFKVHWKTFISLLFPFLSLLAISFLLHNFSVYAILSTSRGYLYMILSYSIFSRNNMVSVKDILFVSLGSVLGWILLSLLQFRQLIFVGANNDSLAVYGNMVALGLLIIIPIINRKNVFILIAITSSIILSLTAGIRRQIVVFFVSVFLSYATLLVKNFRKSKKAILVFLISLIFAINYYPDIKYKIKEMSPILYQRIFVKSERLLNGELTTSDQIRRNYLRYYLNNIDDYILPQGFVSKQTMKDKRAGMYMDFPMIELSYMFGILILLLVIIYFSINIVKNFKKYFLSNNNEEAIWAIMGIILFLLLFLEGSFLNFPYVTPLTGMVLGKIDTFKFKLKD